MPNIDLIEQLTTDKSFLKRLAKKYIELGSFKYVELDLQLPLNSIEETFDECPELSEEFDGYISDITMRRLQREGAYKIFKVIKALDEVVNDNNGVEDGGASLGDKLKASALLVKLIDTPKEKKHRDGDEFDQMMRELENKK